jgi:hypothetical protein
MTRDVEESGRGTQQQVARLPVWRLEADRACVSQDGLSGEVRLARPARGISALSFGQALPGLRLLGVAGADLGDSDSPIPADAYERGGDLVLTYAETAMRPLRVEIYWRVLTDEVLPAAAAGFDLQVSAQTSLLDADSALWSESRVPAQHVARLSDAAADCWLFRGADSRYSYAEMIHPADDRGCLLSRGANAADGWLLRRSLFGERLEKGVILRARLRGLLLPRHDDEQAAIAACESFVASQLPLTT